MDRIETRDIVHAALFMMEAFQFIQMNWEGRQGTWVFEGNSSRANELVKEYVNGDYVANIKGFVEAQRNVRDLLHQ